MLRSRLHTFVGLAATLVIMLGASAANAITVDFTSGTQVNPDVLGNSWTFDGIAPDDITVTAWADIGQLDGGLEAANAHLLGNGLAVCTSTEGASSDPDDLSDCTDRDNRRAVDNAGDYEWLLIMLPERMQIDSFTVYPDGNRKADITYFTGVISGSVDGLTYDELASLQNMTRFDVSNARSTSPSTINFADENGGELLYANAVLIGSQIEAGGSRFMVNEMQVTAVPIPAAMLMFFSGLLVLVFVRVISFS